VKPTTPCSPPCWPPAEPPACAPNQALRAAGEQ
jgi:hypothetical protein